MFNFKPIKLFEGVGGFNFYQTVHRIKIVQATNKQHRAHIEVSETNLENGKPTTFHLLKFNQTTV